MENKRKTAVLEILNYWKITEFLGQIDIPQESTENKKKKPVRREIVEFIRPADNRPLLRKPWLFRCIALQQRGPMLLFACKGAYGPRRLWARSSTSGSMKNPWRMPSFSAMSIFMRRVCTSSKRTNREPLSVR